MPIRPPSSFRVGHACVCVLASASLAFGQLELSKSPPAGPPPPEKPADSNLPAASLPESRRGDLAGKLEQQDGSAPNRDLDLPDPGSRPPVPRAPANPDPRPEDRPAGPGAGQETPARAAAVPGEIAPVADAPTGVAGFVLAELRKQRALDHPLVDQAARSLIQLGDAGLSAGRYALASEHGPTIVAGARVLLAGGGERDFELVVTRLESKLAPNVATAVMRALIDIDPVRASPRLFSQLLGHRQGAVRALAYRQLSERLSPDLLPYLRYALGCEQSDGRHRAVELVAAIPGRESTELLLERLKDRSAIVAYRAATALGLRDDEGLDAALLGRAFGSRWVLREGAYALVALLEREDTALRPILGPAHVEPLLGGLERDDPFVSAVSAAALAGIGFRADESFPTPWLDRDVPVRLLKLVSGQEFSNDFSSAIGVASRRLVLITGEDFGSNGPAWVQWWTAQKGGFRAARAALSIDVAELGRVEFSVRATAGRADAYTLVGPEAAEAAFASRRAGEVFVVPTGELGLLVDLARREGLLSAERLPGTRGRTDSGSRSLELSVGGRSKLFRCGADADEPWFERVFEALAAARERQTWQRHRDTQRFATQLDWWRSEREWWDGEHTELERKLRLKDGIFAALATAPLVERDRMLRELDALYADDAVVSANDFATLVARLREENAANERAKRIIALALRAARALRPVAPNAASTAVSPQTEPRVAATGESASAPEAASEIAPELGPQISPQVAPPIAPEFANDLALAIADSLGTSGAPEIARVLASSGRANVRAAAAHPEPLLRIVAAGELARPTAGADAEADWQVLVRLLEDPVPPVQVATVLALGEQKVEAARTPLLLLARTADGKLRAAALEAAGRLGGDGAFDALMIGLSSGDSSLELAAARGLAVLGDPRTAPLFTSMLAKGQNSVLYAPARDGLLRLGASAHDELLRAARATGAVRREAALLLAEQRAPESAPILMTLFTETPNDSKVASELCVLTCVDLRDADDPAGAWWDWWDSVVHDDSLAWLRQGAERVGVDAPPAEAFVGPSGKGTREGLEFLCRLAARAEPHLAERARRELCAFAGRELGSLPVVGPERDAWLAGLAESLAARFP
ncbi:MAG: hypothetical protein L6Q99_12985 [Planctomycetes bacterium]|nr:hypothetical protein [Planctomycetota bacterium]